jgi:uncharacterized protein involved in response to NO
MVIEVNPQAVERSKSEEGNVPAAERDRQKSLMLRAWIFSGLFFMALPGTLLGFSNLMAISASRGMGPLPAAWMQGHGHAQVFGWIGSFILGIGFYSQPAVGRSAARLQLACFVVWTLGVALRWSTSIYGWHWKILLPVSAGLELAAWLVFYKGASGHKRPQTAQTGAAKAKMPIWMISVLVSTVGFFATLAFNFVECVYLAARGAEPAFPHGLDQRYLVLMGWGLLVPVVWGFSARWLPAFLGIDQPNEKLMRRALALDILGVLSGLAGWSGIATILLASGAVTIGWALQLTRRPYSPAKVQGIHPSFTWFIRIAYCWLIIAGLMSIWAAEADRHGGIWGASRHALTVGFAATMVFSIGPRILPHFGEVQALFSKRLMFLSLLLLQTGCTLRVLSEPLAYEGLASIAWKVLPISGVLELSAVLMFATNLSLTFLLGKSILTNSESNHMRNALQPRRIHVV